VRIQKDNERKTGKKEGATPGAAEPEDFGLTVEILWAKSHPQFDNRAPDTQMLHQPGGEEKWDRG